MKVLFIGFGFCERMAFGQFSKNKHPLTRTQTKKGANQNTSPETVVVLQAHPYIAADCNENEIVRCQQKQTVRRVLKAEKVQRLIIQPQRHELG